MYRQDGLVNSVNTATSYFFIRQVKLEMDFDAPASTWMLSPPHLFEPRCDLDL